MNEQTEHIIEKLRQKFSASEDRELARWVEEELAENPDSIDISDAVERLLKGEPVQYVFQHALWLGLDLRVTPATLIPRPETAELVTLISKRPAQTLRVLDIGTGSGCIAIALKKDHPEWDVCGCDISTDALQVAQENAKRNNVEVKFFPCDILRDIPEGKYDVIVSNPPYVCESEKSTMESRVLDHEPASALFVSDTHPLLFYERISNVAKQLLTPNGMLYFEINERFGSETAELLKERGFRNVEILHDMFGKPRFVTGAWMPDKLFSRAAAYCSTAEHCRREVSDKLKAWGEDSEETIMQILNRLEEEGFIDEQRYAQAFTNDKVRFQGWGKQKIRAALSQKGLTNQTISEALSQIDEDMYNQVLQALAEKKKRELRTEKNAYVLAQKVMRFLVGRGFTVEEARQVL